MRVGAGVEGDGTESDPALPAVEDRAVGVKQLQLRFVQRLFAVASGAPQGGVGDLDGEGGVGAVDGGGGGVVADAGAGGEPVGAAGLGAFDVDAQFGETGRAVEGQVRADAGEPGGGPVLQAGGLPQAGGDQGRPPVPAEGAGHLADVLERLGVGVGPLPHLCAYGLGLGVGGGELHLERGGGLQPVREVEAVTPVHVAGVADNLAADPDGGDGVESVEDEIGALVRGGAGAEHGVVSPVGTPHPGEVRLVPGEERVLDEPGGEQVGVDAAGDRRRYVGPVVAQRPAVGQGGDVLHAACSDLRRPVHRTSRCAGGVRAAQGTIAMPSSSTSALSSQSLTTPITAIAGYSRPASRRQTRPSSAAFAR